MTVLDLRRWSEIQVAFDTLVEVAEPERSDRLEALGRTDPALRAAVEALLAAHSDVDARLGILERALSLGGILDPLGLAGRTVSHFRVFEPIGAGGMGIVYRGEDVRLGRAVALKFPLPGSAVDPAAVSRFRREALAAAALDHPNLCTIHEVGVSEDGRIFLAMPLYAGETLKARLERRTPIPMGDVLAIARQVASGLDSAHAAGIVHRDLKPANIMLLPDGAVKILDFGLAKARDQSLSATGERFGTVSYMAPEQMRGDSIDARADLWALGVVLYEMLTGRKPFDGEESIAVARAVLEDEPPPPSAHQPDVPAALEEIILTLLSKDRQKRYETARVLLDELARAGTGRAAMLQSLRGRWRRTRRRLQRRSLAAFVAVLAVVATFALAALPMRRAPEPAIGARTSIAVLPFRNLSADGRHAYLAGGLHEEVLGQLYRVPVLRVIGRSSVMSYGPTPPPIAQVASELGVGSVVEGSVQVVENRVRVTVRLIDAATGTPLWTQQYDRMLDDAFALQSEIAQQIVATVGAALTSAERGALSTVPTEKTEAYLLYLEGRDYQRRPGLRREPLEAAERLYEQALTLDPQFALAHASLSVVHGNMYWLRYDMTPERLVRQRESAQFALRLAPDLAEAHMAMSAVYNVGQVKVREGLEHLRIAARLSPNDPAVWRAIAQAHRRLGEWDEFVEPFERAVALDPRNADLLWDQGGGTYGRMGRYEEALYWFDRALRIAPGLQPPLINKAWYYFGWQGQLDTARAIIDQLSEDPGLGGETAVLQRAKLLYYERRADSLLRVLERARGSVLQSVAAYTPLSLWTGWAHELRGDSVAARTAYREALVAIDSAIVLYPDDWPLHEARGMALAGLGRREEALREVRWLENCPIYREDMFLTTAVARGAAKILARAGDTEAALDRLERLLADRPPGIGIHPFRVDPHWDPIRGNPRYRALLRKYSG